MSDRKRATMDDLRLHWVVPWSVLRVMGGHR